MGICAGLEYDLVKGKCEETHWHPEVEVLFAVEGISYVTVKETCFTMNKDDVLLINSSMSHRIESGSDSILCCVKYPWKIFTELLGNNSKIFDCNSTVDEVRSYKSIQECLRELIYEYVNSSHKTECQINIILLRILDDLIENYQVALLPSNVGKVSDDLRVQQIIQYVNQNFQHNVNLSDIAKELYVSPSTLSRLFRKQTGIYFVDYVNQVRARFGSIELLYSDENVTKIAINSGFSNLSMFSRVFKDIYGMTPTEYRNRKKVEVKKQGVEKEALRKSLAGTLPAAARKAGGPKNAVKASAGAGTTYRKTWNRAINIGFVDQLTKSNLQAHTLQLKKTLGFRYVRLWNVFSKKLMLTDGKHIGRYNYSHLDEVLDFLASNHIYPYLDMGMRPTTALKGNNDTVFFEYDYVNFQSRRAWEAMVKDFLRHVIKRYGKEEVSHWIFELGCDRFHPEASVFYHDPKDEFHYLEAYEYFYHTIKEYVPEAEVGGASFAIDFDIPFLKEFLTHCREHSCKPDFISFMLFPYSTEMGVNGYEVTPLYDKDAELGGVRQMRELMRETGMDGCKLYACEWNNTLSNRNYLNDSCFRSAYIVRTLNQIWDSLDMVCLRMGSDLVGSYFDTFREADGNCGLLTAEGIRKPAYFALQFMNSLGRYLIDRGPGYIITRTTHGRFYVLCYNYKWYSSNYFLKDEYTEQPEQIDDYFENDKPLEMDFVLSDLPDRATYCINRQLIGREGSLLHEWSNFQYDESLESGEYLRGACFPRMSMVKQEVKNGRLHIKEKLDAHEVVLLHIYENT